MLAQMSRNYQDTKPSALLLTGDQIYADDIGSSVLKRVRKVCEHLNLDVFESSISRSDFSTSIGLTSAKSKNHLLSFGELLAIYLLSWSEKLWHESSKVQDMYDVRCFLAQVPVYMIMDDHDVSDDLKINQAWEHQLKPDGYRYLADAYALGWIFQGMGNLREACEYDELIKQYIENETSRNALSQRVVKEADWSFSFTDNDRSILFLDTRNHRYGGKDFKSPAGLISPEALHCQFSKLSESKDIILVSASPVYGFECVEKLQDDLSFLPDSVTLIDRESWHAPSAHSAEGMCLKVLEDKLNDLSCERLLIISGDTHYSYVRELSLYNKKAIQIVSSALKNKPPLNMLANFVFSKFNQFSKSEKYLNSDQDEKILYHSNYCSLDLKGEMKIQMYSRDQEHKFYPWKS
jgi:hypothetical protein